jgi:hypothetical protein
MLKPRPSLAQTQEMLPLTAHFKLLHDLLAGIRRELAFDPSQIALPASPAADFPASLPKISDVRQRDTDPSSRDRRGINIGVLIGGDPNLGIAADPSPENK